MSLSYEAHNFQPNDILYASDLNEIEAGLISTINQQNTSDTLLTLPIRLSKHKNILHLGFSGLKKDHNYILCAARQVKTHGQSSWHVMDPSDDLWAKRYGYANMAGKLCGDIKYHNHGNYDNVPSWMPNKGYLQTVWPFTPKDDYIYYMDIDLSTWLLDLLCPAPETLGNFENATFARIMGLHRNYYRYLNFTFWLFEIIDDEHEVLVAKADHIVQVNGHMQTAGNQGDPKIPIYLSRDKEGKVVNISNLRIRLQKIT